MGESWSARSRRISRERKAEAKGYGTTGGLWHRQSKNAAKVQKKKRERVQGKGSWTVRANRAAKARKKRAGETRAWWKRLRKQK